ncbi:hypothetical protein J4465_00780 [Candidatus Pacearchaeota archaeon]|nr:hypothetical protein [Candidatus Pacearchaeota archaeon]
MKKNLVKNIANKRAQLTQTTLITIIILILSAAIILFFFKTLYLDTQIDREACRASIELRSNSLTRGITGTELIPLKCKTEEIKINTDNSEIIKKDLANAMYDCWWQLGEGKIDFFSKDSWFNFLSDKDSQKACIICSTIEFEKGAKNKQIDLTNYLAQTKVPLKNITYLQYFSGDNQAKEPLGLNVQKIDTNKKYFITFTGLRGGSWIKTITNAGTITVSGVLLGAGAGCIIGLVGGPIGCAGGAIAGGIGGLITSGVSEGVGAIEDHIFSNMYCDNYVYGDDNRDGCFIMSIIEMTPESLTNQCRNVESIP